MNGASLVAHEQYQYKALALSRLLRFGESHAPVPPRDVARLLGVNAYQLVQQSLENPATHALGMDDRQQAHLRNVVCVIARAHRSLGDIAVALRWYQTFEAPGFAGKTPEALTAQGRIEEVLGLLGPK
jgi:hypothetical protein